MLQSQSVAEVDLDEEVLDLYTRALVLNGADDLARMSLLDAPPSRLTSLTLQKRLVDLTEAELLQSPTSILEATRKRLAELTRMGTEPSAGISARLEEISSAFEEARGQYRIVSPPASPN